MSFVFSASFWRYTIFSWSSLLRASFARLSSATSLVFMRKVLNEFASYAPSIPVGMSVCRRLAVRSRLPISLRGSKYVRVARR